MWTEARACRRRQSWPCVGLGWTQSRGQRDQVASPAQAAGALSSPLSTSTLPSTVTVAAGTNPMKFHELTSGPPAQLVSPVMRLTVPQTLSLIHISEPTRLLSISYAVFCL